MGRLKGADHPYYCQTGCYWATEAQAVQRWSWRDFMAEFGDADPEMNLVWRWDWPEGEDELLIFMMYQRHAKPVTHRVRVTDADEPAVRAFLGRHWALLQQMWAPVSERG